jgi:DNA-binding MarR family transcriptional regulator
MAPATEAAPALLLSQPTWLISQVSAHAHRLLTTRLAAAGARGYHVRVLAALAEYGPASQATLGRRVEMDRSDVTAAVGELAADGLVQRTADASDRRRNVVTITGSGREHLASLAAILDSVQDELLAPLSAGDRTALTGLLTRVLNHHA